MLRAKNRRYPFHIGFSQIAEIGLQKAREGSDYRTASDKIMGYFNQSLSFVSASLMHNMIDEVIDACDVCIQNHICDRDQSVYYIRSESSSQHVGDKVTDKTISSWKTTYK